MGLGQRAPFYCEGLMSKNDQYSDNRINWRPTALAIKTTYLNVCPTVRVPYRNDQINFYIGPIETPRVVMFHGYFRQ